MNVIVIGGGAAGIFGAIACAEANPHAEVTVLEASPRCLSKVLISGGGRCNVTHACFDPALLVQSYPRGGKALRGAFSRWQPRHTVAWFAERGVELKTEADGRMFPRTDQAITIANALLQAAATAGVKIYTHHPVQAIQSTPAGFHLQIKGQSARTCDRLLLATGSSPVGYRLAQALDHTVLPPVPSLFTFNIPEAALHELAGIAVEAIALQLELPDHPPLKQSGALLITHWGLSGPAILKLSAWGARALAAQRYQASLRVNWVPQNTADQVRQALQATKLTAAKRAIGNESPFPFPKRLWRYLVERAAIAPTQPWAEQSNKALHRLQQELTQGVFAIAGKGVFKDEFVTCGGVPLTEVDFKTMQSRRCPGLALAGEVLDIDGVTGGFNFQAAWTTGWIAGQALAQ